MRFKSICKHGIRAVCCLLMVIFIVPGTAVCSAEKNSGADSGDADVATWLAELDSSPGVVSSPSSEHKGKVAIKANSTSHGREDSEIKNISIDFYKIDLHNVFRLLGQVSKKNIVVDEGVSGTLTLALQNVPWTFVLQVIKNLKGLSSHEVNNTIMIYPSGKAMTWESGDETGDVMGPGMAGGDTGGTSGGLSIEAVPVADTGMLNTGLEIETAKISKVPPEQISVAAKLIKQADDYGKKGNWDKAEQLLQKASEIWFDNPALLKKTANVALRNDDELNGYNYGRKALELDNSDSEAAAITAVALARMSRTGEARTYFERAMAGRNVSLNTLWNYAVFSFSQNDFRNALRLITRIEMNYSLTPDLMMLKARTYENLSRNDKAIQEYKAIITAGKDVPPDMIQFARMRLNALTASMSQIDNQAR